MPAPVRMSTREARANFSDMLGRVHYTKEPVIIEKKGRPFAVVISPDDYEAFAREREQGFAAVDAIRARNSSQDTAEVENDVTEAVESVRQEMHDERKKTTSGSH
jgi:antitoxin YefM